MSFVIELAMMYTCSRVLQEKNRAPPADSVREKTCFDAAFPLKTQYFLDTGSVASLSPTR